MPEEEKTAVEETKAAEEEKAEAEEAEAEEKVVEEKVVEEKTVEETKAEAKTDEKAKAGDALVETRFTDGGSGDSEVSYEMQKAIETIPPELPPGAVFTFNVHHVVSDEYSENYVRGCVGLFDGAVLKFHIVSGEVQYGNVMDYSAFINNMVHPTGTAPKVLELSGCGRSLPSKESTRFAMSITLIGGSK